MARMPKKITAQAPALLALLTFCASSMCFVFFHRQDLLHLAVGIPSSRGAQLMLFVGAEASQLDPRSGKTPLSQCLEGLAQDEGTHRSALVDLLIGAGADPNQPDSEGWTPLMIGAETGKIEVVKQLVEHGALVDQRAEGSTSLDGMTPLMVAAHNGYDDIVLFLLNNGADINARSSSGFTPLIVAASKGHLETARLLVSKGAVVSLSTVESAIRYGHPAVIAYLQEELEKGPSSKKRLITRYPEE